MCVVWGRCGEGGGAPVLWPWLQVLRSLGRGEELLLPSGALVSAAADEVSAARFEVAERLIVELVAAAQELPLVILLEDCHWADDLSLAVVEIIAPRLKHERILVVLTVRADEVSVAGSVRTMLSGVGRWGERLDLVGWSVAEVGEFVRRVTGREA